MNYKGDLWYIVTGYGIDVDRNVFREVWEEYGITPDEKDLIFDLWQKSDEISSKR